jgi:hypothetical protein
MSCCHCGFVVVVAEGVLAGARGLFSSKRPLARKIQNQTPDRFERIGAWKHHWVPAARV